MYSYTIVQWLFFFYFYCFFGWCFESTYVSLKEKRLVNRGFMRGPFLPLYGSGGIMMLVVSAPFQEQAEDLRLKIKELTSGIEAGLDKLKELLTQSPAEHLEVLWAELKEKAKNKEK